jgi:hypothetical protein
MVPRRIGIEELRLGVANEGLTDVRSYRNDMSGGRCPRYRNLQSVCEEGKSGILLNGWMKQQTERLKEGTGCT